MTIKHELANRKEPTRFILKGDKNMMLAKGFEMMDELNKIEQLYLKDDKMKIIRHRVGLTTDSQLILDVDHHDADKFDSLFEALVFFFPGESWVRIKTLNGYQIISKTKEQSSYKYRNLKILRADLPREHDAIYAFNAALEKFLEKFREEHPNPPKNLFNELLATSGLINPIGEFDYLYNVLSAINGHGSIRLTKKSKDDKWELIPA